MTRDELIQSKKELEKTDLRRYQHYPKYNDSGIDWLVTFPEHWSCKRIKYFTTINDETLPENTNPDFNLLYVDIGNVNLTHGILEKELIAFEDAPSRARRIVKDGDTIVSTVRTYLRAITPIKNPEDNLIVSTGFAVVRPRKVDKEFLSYLLRSPYFIETVVSMSVGVSYPAINSTALSSIYLPLPSISEQKLIAAFLDRETERIDRLIEKKRCLIDLLKEKRTALISHAVTKGLNPKAPMKPSGIDWLGDIPEHWEIKKLKYVSKLKSGESITSLSIEDVGKYPVYGGHGLRGYTSEFTHKGEYILIGRQGAQCGNVLHVKGTFWASEHAVVTTLNTHLDITWMYFLLSNMNLNQYSISAAQPGISVEKIQNLFIPVPPCNEQYEISVKLKSETSGIDELIQKIETANLSLLEYRSALISATVTGKIDVREEINE